MRKHYAFREYNNMAAVKNCLHVVKKRTVLFARSPSPVFLLFADDAGEKTKKKVAPFTRCSPFIPRPNITIVIAASAVREHRSAL